MEIQPPNDTLIVMSKSEIFVNNEFYHIYNRGVEKRNIFDDIEDLQRFYQSLREFNSVEPIGSIFENHLIKNNFGDPTSKKEKLIDFIAYCLNPNHYHLILEQLVENGISTFMKRLGGYTMYFNEKYKRTGALFQGRYKCKHINSNDYLLHLSAYVNLNNKVHNFGDPTSKINYKSSWREYTDKNCNEQFCKKDIILDQFGSSEDYENFAREALELIQEKKKNDREIRLLAID